MASRKTEEEVGGWGLGAWGVRFRGVLQVLLPPLPVTFSVCPCCQVTQTTPVDGTTQPTLQLRAATFTWILGRQPVLNVDLVPYALLAPIFSISTGGF